MNKTVGIIVPVYNRESFARVSLDSVRLQTYKDWVCYVIDDGSTDGTGAVADEYALSDSRFKVIHQENGGIAVARNRGLDEAGRDGIAQYIMFLDSDDILEPYAMQRIMEIIDNTDADIVQWQAYDFTDNAEDPWLISGRNIRYKYGDSFSNIEAEESRTVVGTGSEEVVGEGSENGVGTCSEEVVREGSENDVGTGSEEVVGDGSGDGATTDSRTSLEVDSKGALTVLLDTKGIGGDKRFHLLWNNCRCVWTKCCKAEVYDGVRCPVGKSYEDDFIVDELFMNASKIVFINEDLTNYRKHSSNFLKKIKLKDRLDHTECERVRFEHVVTFNDYKLNNLAAHNVLISSINSYMFSFEDNEPCRVVLREMKKTLSGYTKYMGRADKIVFWGFCLCPLIMTPIYRAYRKKKG